MSGNGRSRSYSQNQDEPTCVIERNFGNTFYGIEELCSKFLDIQLGKKSAVVQLSLFQIYNNCTLQTLFQGETHEQVSSRNVILEMKVHF